MIKEISFKEVNEFFKADPVGCVLGLCDEDLVNLHKNNTIHERPLSNWYGAYHVDTLVAIIRTEHLSKDTVITHIYMHREHRRTGMLKFVYVDLVNHLLEHTNYTETLVPVPDTCSHVIRAVYSLGFELQGVVPNSLIWRNQEVNLLYYTRNIRDAK